MSGSPMGTNRRENVAADDLEDIGGYKNKRKRDLRLLCVEVDRVFVVVFAAEDDLDVAVVFRAVQLEGFHR